MNTTLKETLKTLVTNMKAFLSANYPTINSLTGSAEIATKNSNTVVIKSGISESGGVISNSVGVDITLADVASTGSYADLSNKPAIKAGQGENSIIEGDINNNVTGIFSHAEGYHTEASGNYGSHAEGNETTASGFNSHAEGTLVTASGASSHAEGGATTASGNNSHAEGYHTTANHKSQHVFGEYNGVDPSDALSNARGNYVEIVGNGTDDTTRSNARTLDWGGNETLAGNLTIEGTITANGQQILPQKQADWNQTTSTESDYILNKPAIKAGQGVNSIIEGDLDGNSSTGNYSHTEGGSTTASGQQSHAEGGGTKATGNYSHAEGGSTTASGDYSHAEGGGTKAKNKSQHVFGEYNIADPSSALSSARGTYIEIVGKGTTITNRSNARTLDWSGNEVLSGTITANGINLNEEINLKEPLLPATPTQPESKFLNANKQWVEMTIGHSQLRDLNGDSSYLHITSAEKAAFAAKQDALIAGNNITIVGNTISSTGGLTNVYKSITIENPTASENMCIFYTPFAMTITEIRGVITGGNSVSFKVVSGTSRNAVTTEHNSSAVVCSSVTTGDVATITTAAIAAGSWVAVKTSAVEGAPSELVITLSLTF